MPSTALSHAKIGRSASAPSAATISNHTNIKQIFDRTTLTRCFLWSLFTLGIGYLLCTLWLPYLPDEYLQATILRHIPPDDKKALAWLSLCGARVPYLFPLAVAGLTRFSGGLCSTILAYRSLCDGAALCLAVSLFNTNATIVETVSRPALLIALVIWSTADLLIRTLLASEARRFARETAQSTDMTIAEERSRLRYCLWRYAAFAASALFLTLIFCALHVILLGRV